MPPNNLIIRNLHKDDYHKNYLELLKQLTSIDPKEISSNKFTKFINKLDDNHQIVVIEDNNKIIGTVTILIENKLIHNMGKVGHIEDVIVDNAFRGMGLGKILINKALDVGKIKECYKMLLACSEDNKPFYEKCGFIPKELEMALYF